MKKIDCKCTGPPKSAPEKKMTLNLSFGRFRSTVLNTVEKCSRKMGSKCKSRLKNFILVGDGYVGGRLEVLADSLQ